MSSDRETLRATYGGREWELGAARRLTTRALEAATRWLWGRHNFPAGTPEIGNPRQARLVFEET